MSVFSRFFGKQDEDDSPVSGLVANPAIESPLSLQVLFSETCPQDSGELIEAFRRYHSSMAAARCDIDPELSKEGKLFGIVGWGKHLIRFVGFNLPMPPEAVERCVAPSHYPQELKDSARAHKAHVILYYAGYDSLPLEQYVALAAITGVLAELGAVVVLNESSHTSFPTAALANTNSDGDIMDLLRSFPLPILYCGFVKYDVEGVPGVWMRTYGAHLLGLPDFAAHAAGHDEGQQYFDMFDNVFRYLLESEARMAPGHTMQIGDEEFLRVREPSEDEEFLASDTELLVVEVIGPDEIR